MSLISDLWKGSASKTTLPQIKAGPSPFVPSYSSEYKGPYLPIFGEKKGDYGMVSKAFPEKTSTGGGGVFKGAETVSPKPVAANPDAQIEAFKKATGGEMADIPAYAGMNLSWTKPTAVQAGTTVNELQAYKSDILTGVSDPYKMASQSGIPYTAAELNAIEKATAGVYDPAINSALARLDAAKESEARKEEFGYDLALYKAKKAIDNQYGGDLSGRFTQTQLNKAAANAALPLTDLLKLDPEIINFYLNPASVTDPDTNKSISQNKLIEKQVQEVLNGNRDAQEVIDNIMSSTTLSEIVKQYYIKQLPISDEEKKGWLRSLWDSFTGLFS